MFDLSFQKINQAFAIALNIQTSVQRN